MIQHYVDASELDRNPVFQLRISPVDGLKDFVAGNQPFTSMYLERYSVHGAVWPNSRLVAFHAAVRDVEIRACQQALNCKAIPSSRSDSLD